LPPLYFLDFFNVWWGCCLPPLLGFLLQLHWKNRISSLHPLSTLLWQPTHLKSWEQQKDFKFHKISPTTSNFLLPMWLKISVELCVSCLLGDSSCHMPKSFPCFRPARQVSAGLPASAGANRFPLPNK
jgi:hypothetical protein